jgi:hypothetical protein
LRFSGRSRRTRATPVVSLTVTLMCWAPSMLFSNYSALESASGVDISFRERRKRPKLWRKPGRPRTKPRSRVTLACANERWRMQEADGGSRSGSGGSIQGQSKLPQHCYWPRSRSKEQVTAGGEQTNYGVLSSAQILGGCLMPL